jgi:mono/diheme cytochrome c family protein
VLLLSSVTCQMGVFAVERGQIRRSASIWNPAKWGPARVVRATFLMGLYFVLGQGYEYLSLIRDGLTLQSSGTGRCSTSPPGFHGLHVTGGLIAFLFLLGRTYAAKTFTQDSRSAPSSSPTTGTSSSRLDRPVHDHLPHPLTSHEPPRPRPETEARSEQDQAAAQTPGRRYAVLLLGLLVVGVAYAAITGAGGAASAATPGGPSPADIARGQAIFANTCSSCHGMNAQGTESGPSLVGVGAAAVDFQMSTGRMPGKDFDAEMPRKPVTFTTEQIHQVAAYIASLGGGPAIPSPAQVSTAAPTSGWASRSSSPTARSATTSPVRAARSPTASRRRR